MIFYLFFKQVQFTYKRPSDQSNKSLINQYCKFKLLSDIKDVFTLCGELDDFVKSCFGHFLNFDADAMFSSHLEHHFLAMEITFEGIGQNEIWFGIR